VQLWWIDSWGRGLPERQLTAVRSPEIFTALVWLALKSTFIGDLLRLSLEWQL